MKTQYNIAIIGTGNIANKMAEALNFVNGAVKYAVASRTQEKANEFAKKWNFKKGYGSYLDVALDKDVDVVYIATPHNSHCELTLMCLDNGKHVICEKPLAVNSFEVASMIEKAKSKGLFLMEAMWSCFLPHFEAAKELVTTNQLGDINLLEANFSIKRPFDAADRKFNAQLIGGSLMDLGIYPIFLSQYLFNQPKHISSMAALGPTGVDHTCSITLGYDDLKLAVLHSSFVAETGVNASIYGEKATLKFDTFWYMPSNLLLTKHNGKEQHLVFDVKGNGYNYEMDEVINCLNKGLIQSPKMSWHQSTLLINTLDTIRKQCKIVYSKHD